MKKQNIRKQHWYMEIEIECAGKSCMLTAITKGEVVGSVAHITLAKARQLAQATSETFRANHKTAVVRITEII